MFHVFSVVRHLSNTRVHLYRRVRVNVNRLVLEIVRDKALVSTSSECLKYLKCWYILQSAGENYFYDGALCVIL